MGSETVILDCIEFPDTGTFSCEDEDNEIHGPGDVDQTIGGTKVRLSQPITLQLIKKSSLAAHGKNKSSPDISPQITPQRACRPSPSPANRP